MPILYMLCGKVGSGKSTYARKMEAESGAIVFSEDEYMLHFYGHIDGRDEFIEKFGKCQEMIYRTCEKFLRLGHNVILDFGFWKRSDRDYLRERFAKYDIKLIYFNYRDEVTKKRINYRNENLKDYEYFIDDHLFELFGNWFEEPDEDENAIIIE